MYSACISCHPHVLRPPQDERVAVCSIEKANVALNKMLSEGRLDELAAVVVDEVHMVADPHRWAGRGVGLLFSGFYQ
jgi:DNA polymerase theta